MLLSVRVIVLAFITSILVACGGGGGDGGVAAGPTPNFAGNYQISTSILISNTCGDSPAAVIAGGGDTIVQNGRNISASGGALTGAVDDDNGGFTITKTETTATGLTTVISMKFRVTAAGASTFTVQLNGLGSIGSASCAVSYTGTATKI
jgi:hypothetical protein